MKAARLVVLTVAVAAGGVAAMLAGRSEKPPEAPVVVAAKPDTVDILVAKSNIGMGQSLAAGDLEWQPWPKEAATGNFIRKSDRATALEDLSGQIARYPFVAGEPIREAKLVNAKGSGFMAAILPPGMRAVSTQITPETSAGGFILPNDHVDVILTRRDREAEKATGIESHTSEIVLSNIRVLAIDQNVEEKGAQKVVIGKTATLELNPAQVETLALSQQRGTLSLALRSITDAEKNDGPVQNNRNTGVNIVRFGVSTVSTPR
ncbi:MAG: Flp pilus assembly protein CpaB [Pseudolabrys sp.]|jgi:pilus assembly protein CpaB